jgi:hypothetical protein
MRDGLYEPARGKWIPQKKRIYIVVCETPTTTSFPTCSEEHRYMKAVIVSIIALNNGVSDSRKWKCISALYKSTQQNCLQTITRFAARAAERVSTGADGGIRWPIPRQPFLDVPLRVTYYTRHRSEQHRRYKGEETERKPARCYLSIHKAHCRASFPLQPQGVQRPNAPWLIREVLVPVRAPD